jgi:formylglycine-generating enzyme required for sulfatase activity
LIQCLVDQRLLATDVTQSGEAVVEPAHETLLRQWGLLQGWLAEDAGLLGILEGIKRGSRDWAANKEDPGWLSHSDTRLQAVERLYQRPDIAARLEPTDRRYLAACRARESAAGAHRRRIVALVGTLCALAIAGLGYAGWSNFALLKTYADVGAEFVWPKTLSATALQALQPKAVFKECAGCPEMVVVPAGKFVMGAPEDEARGHDPNNRSDTSNPANKTFADELPRHEVTIARPFAVARYEVTFEEWNTCVLLRGCPSQDSDEGWGRGRQPVIHVTWEQAKLYTKWLAKRTGKPYRLLSEAEWEYAARAGSDTSFAGASQIDKGTAKCDGCGSQWDNKRAAPVGQFPANAFGLHDVHGNVWEWVEDCYQSSYDTAPADGTAVIVSGCVNHVLRGGSFYNWPINLRSAARNWLRPDFSRDLQKAEAPPRSVGFRVARTFSQ